MKFVKQLSDDEILTLNESYKNHSKFRVRNRAKALLLSAKNYSIASLQQLFGVGRDTISAWIDAWDTKGIIGIFDEPRSGRPAILTPGDRSKFKAYVDENPHQLKAAVSHFERETGKSASLYTYKRCLKNQDYIWKRCRHSLKGKRDDIKFENEKITQEFIKQKEGLGEINAFYFDGSGFSTKSSIPYAWQKIGTTHEIPCNSSKRLNVLGFMNRRNESYFHAVDTTVNSNEVIAAFDGFAEHYCKQYEKDGTPCVVMLDNASIHHSKAVEGRMADWTKQGIFLHFLPTYSPEHNLIEILWRKIKYEWLPINCYENRKLLKDSVLGILNSFGSEYKITFA